MALTQRSSKQTGMRRSEMVFGLAFFVAIVVLFLISFTGRSAFGDDVKTALTVLSAITGGVGFAGGLVILGRGLQHSEGRFSRLLAGVAIAFVGGYTVIHVLA